MHIGIGLETNPSTILEIWTSLSIDMLIQLGLNVVEIRSIWCIRVYVTVRVRLFACHHVSPSSLGHDAHCETELAEIE